MEPQDTIYCARCQNEEVEDLVSILCETCKGLGWFFADVVNGVHVYKNGAGTIPTIHLVDELPSDKRQSQTQPQHSDSLSHHT